MHVISLVLALIVTSPPESRAERWESHPTPGWEMFGKEDALGQFRYSVLRQKSTATKNYGVNLSEHAPTPGATTVMGTDGNTAKLLLTKATTAAKLGPPTDPGSEPIRQFEFQSGKACAHSDCNRPDGQCDRKPTPFKKKPEISITPFAFQPFHVAWILGGFAVLIIVGVGFLFVCVCAYAIIVKLLSKRPPS